MQLSLSNRALAIEYQALMMRIGRDILRMREGGIATTEKTGFRDIVTEADKFSEGHLTEFVSGRFPEDGILGEEGASRPSKSGSHWIFDPVDGTTNFASGLPFFGISAGREKDGESDLGALYFPAFRDYFFAVKGEGAVLWGKSLVRPASSRKLRDSVVALGATPGHEHLFPKFRERARNVLAFGSAVYEAMLVAQGQIGAYVHTGATPFDLAAAVVIASEAGCAVSGLDGKPIDLRQDKIPVVIAADNALRDEVLSVCAGTL